MCKFELDKSYSVIFTPFFIPLSSLNREDLIYISLWDVSEGNCFCIKSNTNWNRKFLGFTMISYAMAEEHQNEGSKKQGLFLINKNYFIFKLKNRIPS
jgi:hypothetical protein